jgi:acetyl esterase/lipase
MSMEAVSAAVMAATLDECQEAVRLVLRERDYTRIALVGKSIGTGIVAHLCCEEPLLKKSCMVHLTPTLEVPLFDPLFARTRQAALLAMGTADPFYDEAALDRLRQQRSFDLCLVEGADHSLVVPGDLDTSLAALHKVVRTAAEFILHQAV